MAKYYLITGLDEGREIKPFAVKIFNTAVLDTYVENRGEDCVRYYAEISRAEFLKYFDQETQDGIEWARQNGFRDDEIEKTFLVERAIKRGAV